MRGNLYERDRNIKFECIKESRSVYLTLNVIGRRKSFVAEFSAGFFISFLAFFFFFKDILFIDHLLRTVKKKEKEKEKYNKSFMNLQLIDRMMFIHFGHVQVICHSSYKNIRVTFEVPVESLADHAPT